MESGRPWLEEELLAQSDWVRALARSLVHDEGAAEDLFQDTWVAALRSPPSERGALRGWLARVTRHLAWKRQRSQANSPMISVTEELSEGARDQDPLERLELHRLLAEELQSLREPLRSTLIERYFNGRSAAEIAEREGVPAPTVRWRLQQGLKELRERLDRRHGGKRESWVLALGLGIPGVKEAALSGTGIGLTGALAMSTLLKFAIAGAVLVALTLALRPQFLLWELASRATEPVYEQHKLDTVDSSSAPKEPLEARATAETAREALAALTPSIPAAETTLDSSHARIVARVIDEAGKPIDGAWIERVDKPPVRAPAKPNGSVALEWEVRDAHGSIVCRVGAPNRVTTSIPTEYLRGQVVHLGDVLLLRAGSIAGKVVDPRGAPLSGVDVFAIPAGRLDAQRSTFDGELTLTPDSWMSRQTETRIETLEDGTFRLDGVVPGAMRVWADRERKYWAHSPVLDIQPDVFVKDIVLVLSAPAPAEQGAYEIRGIVLDPDGKPLPELQVTASTEGYNTSYRGTTNAEGRFHISTVTRHPHFLFVNAALRPIIYIGPIVPGPEEHTLQFRASQWLRIDVSAKGDVVTDFHIVVTGEGVKQSVPLQPVEGEGRNVVKVLVPDGEFRVAVDADGYELAEFGPFKPEESPGALRVELVSLARVEGHVRAQGEPVAGAKLELHRIADDREVYAGDFPMLVEYNAVTSASSDLTGAFHLSPREPGAYRLFVSAEGFARADIGPLELDPKIGLRNLQVDLLRGGALEGRVLRPKGTSPEGVIVGINRGDGAPRTQRTGPDGSFRFEGLTPGSWNLSLKRREVDSGRADWMSGGSRPATIEWNFVIADGQTTRQDLDLRAPTTCSVHGHLTVQGSPAVGWSIGTTRVGSGVFGGVQPNGDTDFAGNFTLEVDDPAEYEFSIHSVGADASSLTIEEHSVLHRGENTWSRDLQTASVQGKLHGANTRRLWYRSGEGASFKARADFTVDATGTFSLAVVPTGPGEIVEWVSGAKELAVLAQFTAHLGLVEQVEVR